MIAALIALLALLMLGGSDGQGWTAELDDSVKKQVAEKGREDAVLDALENHEEVMEEVAEELQEHFSALLESHIDFKSGGEDFDRCTANLKAQQSRAFQQDLELRRIMKKQLSKTEWSAVLTGKDN